jgi:hypothetical protein
MSILSPSASNGKDFFDLVETFVDYDDRLDYKESGSPVAVATEFPARELMDILDTLRYVNAVVKAGVPLLDVEAAAESSNNIDVTIQIRDASDYADLADEGLFEMWLADSATGWETAAAPDGGISVQTGVAADVPTASKRIRAITDATGTLVVRVTESGAGTWYLRVRGPNGKVETVELTFAA